MHLPPGVHPGIQFDLAEGGLVAGDVLLEQSKESLGLLRAHVDTLKVTNLDLSFALLLYRAENKEEIPHIHSHLHAISIGFPIFGGIGQLDIGLRRNIHEKQCK